MRKLDIRGTDLHTDQRVKLLALWQANQELEGEEPAGDHLLLGVAVTVLVFLVLAAIASWYNAF